MNGQSSSDQGVRLRMDHGDHHHHYVEGSNGDGRFDLTVRPPSSVVCPDCPAARGAVLEELLCAPGHTCGFRSLAVPARHPLPHRWFELYGLGLVRRGIVIRQRVDGQGHATAVDAIGSGGVFPLSQSACGGTTTAAYAATDVLCCVLPTHTLDAALSSGSTAADLVRLQAAALERVERIADARSRPTAASRVAALVVALSDTLSPARRRDVLPAGLLQRDLAALLAVRHESVCRILGRLTQQGLIARESEGLRINDRSQLESM